MRTTRRPGWRARIIALTAAAGLMALAGGAGAAEERALGAERREALVVTVYGQDLALVREVRRAAFAAGENRVALTDVSPALRPETLALAGEGLRLVEQSFQFDLLSRQRLLERSVGEMVWVVRTHPETGAESRVEAEVLSVADGLVLRIGERIETDPGGRIAFPGIPEGLRARPALVARLDSAEAGERALTLQYLTAGLTWQADYVAELGAAEDRLDLTGLVTLTNTSGLAYPGARLRLVAGQVHRAGGPVRAGRTVAMMAEAAEPPPGMAARPAGDLHLYEVPRPVSLAEQETKQVVLLAAAEIPVVKTYRFEELVTPHGGAEEIGPVQAAVAFTFENEAAVGGPGRPLPAGVVRVYRPAGADGGGEAPIFAGEAAIDHTPVGEEVALEVSRAFDVTGRARLTHFERISGTSYELGQEITVANARDQAVSVEVVGRMPPGWRMLEESRPHEAETANRIVWTLPVDPGGETRLTYRVRVTRP